MVQEVYEQPGVGWPVNHARASMVNVKKEGVALCGMEEREDAFI